MSGIDFAIIAFVAITTLSSWVKMKTLKIQLRADLIDSAARAAKESIEHETHELNRDTYRCERSARELSRRIGDLENKLFAVAGCGDTMFVDDTECWLCSPKPYVYQLQQKDDPTHIYNCFPWRGDGNKIPVKLIEGSVGERVVTPCERN